MQDSIAELIGYAAFICKFPSPSEEIEISRLEYVDMLLRSVTRC